MAGQLLGPQVGVARLSKNENPYGPPASALRMMDYASKRGAYYPSEARMELAKKIAHRHGVSPMQVVITTGSTEALSAIAYLYGRKGQIITPHLYYNAPTLYAERLVNAKIQRIKLMPDMNIDLNGIEQAVTETTGLVYLCNPNNPTGLIMNAEALKQSIKKLSKKTTVLIDEAYIEITDNPEVNSCVELVKCGYDVIVTRTFSKIYGMAGVRIGYSISSLETAKMIRETAMSWVSGIGLAGAIGCFDDFEFLENSKKKIIECREMVSFSLKSLGLKALPSQANFVYFKSGIHAEQLKELMAKRSIIICGQFMDNKNWSRVSIGRPKDVQRFCDALPILLSVNS